MSAKEKKRIMILKPLKRKVSKSPSPSRSKNLIKVIRSDDELGHLHLDNSQVIDNAGQELVIAFDFDGTIFENNEDEYVYSKEIFTDKLFEYIDKTDLKRVNVRILIFSNQAGIASKKVSYQAVQDRFELFLTDFIGLRYDIHVLFAPSKNKYRKPYPGLYDYIMEYLGLAKDSLSDQSIYVGDAAGRAKIGKCKKDFSCSDYHFAQNINLLFMTPEQFFIDYNIKEREFCTKHCRPGYINKSGLSVVEFMSACPIINKPTAIFMIGVQGSGKTNVAEVLNANGYGDILSLDICGTVARLKKEIKGQNIIIDNTHNTAKSRAQYLDLLSGYTCLALQMTTSTELAEHMRNMRVASGGKNIPIIAVRTCLKHFVAPAVEEGFDQIYKIHPDVNSLQQNKYWNYIYM